jgi:hypothetical protein
MGIYVKTNTYFWSNLAHFLEWEVFHTKVVKEMKTHFIPSLFFYHVVNEIIWKIIVGLDRPQTTVWCMCIACWIWKVKNTQNIRILFVFHCNSGCMFAPHYVLCIHGATQNFRNLTIKTVTVTPCFHRLLQSSPLGHVYSYTSMFSMISCIPGSSQMWVCQ